MKRYEEVKLVRANVKTLGGYYSRRTNAIENLKRDMKIRQDQHEVEMSEFKRMLEELETDKANYYKLLQKEEKKLERLEKKPEPKPAPKPVPVAPPPEPKINPEELAIKERQAKLDELERLKKELGVDENEEGEDEIKKEQEAVLKEVSSQVNEKLSELHAGKSQCPECLEWFTKGGAYAAHYKSHFNGD